MTHNTRASRRRRLLHDGSSETTPTTRPAMAGTNASEGLSSRYAPKTDSVSFVLASQLLPRSWGAISLVMSFFALVLAASVLSDIYLSPWVAAQSPDAARWLLLGLPATFASWWASTLWLATAGMALLLFGLRRQRMNDLRSQYRWWLLAAAASVMMSLSASTPLSSCVAAELAKLAGWSPLAADAFWWLVPGGLLLGALAIRMVVDLAESRLALVVAIVASGTMALGWLLEAGTLPGTLATAYPKLATPQLGPALSLGAVSLVLLATLLYARRIVLEAEGVIAPPQAKKSTTAKPSASKTTQAKKRKRAASEASTAVPATQAAPAAEKATSHDSQKERTQSKRPTPSQTDWVSGDESGYQDEYEESSRPRKLSKAERKRLRKQKARHAA